MKAGISGYCGEARKARCRSLLFLTVLLSFFLLPLHSDPSVLIVLSVMLALLASTGISISHGFPRGALIAFAAFALVAFAASLHSPETLSKFPIVILWGGALFAGTGFIRAYPGHQYPFFLATALAILISLGVVWVQGIPDASSLSNNFHPGANAACDALANAKAWGTFRRKASPGGRSAAPCGIY